MNEEALTFNTASTKDFKLFLLHMGQGPANLTMDSYIVVLNTITALKLCTGEVHKRGGMAGS
jgi:hypothetical protein